MDNKFKDWPEGAPEDANVMLELRLARSTGRKFTPFFCNEDKANGWQVASVRPSYMHVGNEHAHIKQSPKENRYLKPFTKRMIDSGGHFDVYDVLNAFNPQSEQIRHAVKKLLVTGGRLGGKTALQDIDEAIWSLEEAKKELS